MEAPALTQARVVHVFEKSRACGRVGPGGVIGLDADLLGFCLAQGQLIAADLVFNGVAHGGVLDQGDHCAGGDAHVQEVLAQRALSSHRADDGGLIDFELSQRASHTVRYPFSVSGPLSHRDVSLEHVRW